MSAQKEQSFEDFFKRPLRTRRKAWIIAGVIAVFFLVLIFISIDWVFGALVHTRKEVQVPDITQKPVTAALNALAANNLALKQAGVEFAKDVPSGSVLRQLPTAGSTVREGRIIRVWISQGDEMAFVPNVVGSDLRAAQLAVRQAGLLVNKVENAYSLTHEKGLIVSQSLKADSMVEKGQGIDLVISNGQPPSSVVLVPNFKNKKLSEATLWASAQNIDLIIKEDPDSVFPNGTIAAQNPEGDSQMTPGSNLEVTVSRRQVEGDEKVYHLHYEMPQGKNASRVRVLLIDELGEREMMNDMQQPGSKIDVEIPYSGKATVRISVDGVLVREREVL
ncbi:PASTA domain-containing protein [Candidatus Avelusimicrobium faecicola]|uniref:PASTA domain-containing protein n=1 Tax=Candidatus Avelusimicrobium faecicola TaxID=3416205 RepID=UPI0015A2C175|nr:PASTA domain-containing protein [Spirochaetota bacterium]MCI7535726.1 PASTA domain-containing protein [Spirochaetota bacterium]MDY2940014.1 PASTA domain-containing protein [Elusimicrobiaceae bacterium]